ncbi:SH3 domain-containing protein [candidate division KSB1 bacterium]|nr:SH3 domain-containing protein [candidate division KSB1 bacterium]
MIVKKYGAIILAIALLVYLSGCATQYNTKAQGRIIVTEMTNVKAQPSHSAADIATIDRGETVLLVGKREQWYKVRLPSAQFGWIHESVVKPESFKTLVLNRDVELRYRPDKYAAVMMIIPSGTEVREFERQGEWVKIQVGSGGTIGWSPRALIGEASVIEVGGQGVRLFTNRGSNIRSGPGTRFQKITTVPSGKSLQWVSTSGSWFQVRLPDNSSEGYIWKDLVTRQPYRTVFNNSACDLKSEPSLSALTVNTLSEQFTKLVILDSRNGWYLVELPMGSLGWIDSNNTTDPRSSSEYPEYDPYGSSEPMGLYFAINRAMIYSDRDGRGSVVSTVQPGMQLKITKSQDTWCAVTLPDGKSGYISANDFADAKGKYLVTTDQVNVREGAGTGFRQLFMAEIGLDVILLGATDDWCKVVFVDGRETGWISSRFLSPSKYRVIFVTENGANVRSTNDTRNSPIDQYDSGIEITYVSKNADWYKFNPLVPNRGSVAWIHEQVVSVPRYGYGIATRQEAIQLGAGQNHQGLGYLMINDEVPIIDQKGTWYLIEMPNHPRMGYVSQGAIAKAPYTPLIVIRNTILRSQSNDYGSSMTSIEPGTELTMLKNEYQWLFVKLIRADRNLFGWVQQADVAEPDYGTINLPSGRNIRYGPGMEYQAYSNTYQAQKLKILDCFGDWIQVRIGSNAGWIYRQETIADDLGDGAEG